MTIRPDSLSLPGESVWIHVASEPFTRFKFRYNHVHSWPERGIPVGCNGDPHLLMVMGTPTWDTSVTVIWKRWYRTLKACRSHGVSATV